MGNGQGNVQIDLLPGWNHVEIKVELEEHEVFDVTIHQCGIYVFKQGTNMENILFEDPNSTVFAELVPRNVLKRGEAFHLDNEPLKKLSKKHKPRDQRGKFHNLRIKKMLHTMLLYYIITE